MRGHQMKLRVFPVPVILQFFISLVNSFDGGKITIHKPCDSPFRDIATGHEGVNSPDFQIDEYVKAPNNISKRTPEEIKLSEEIYEKLVSDHSPPEVFLSYDEVFAELTDKNSINQKIDEVSKSKYINTDIDTLNEKWSELVVTNWQHKGLNLELMHLMSTYLQLKDRGLHVPIIYPVSQDDYNQIKQCRKNSRHFDRDVTQVEAAIKEVLGELEFLRRIKAFRLALHHHTIAANWEVIMTNQLVVSRFAIQGLTFKIKRQIEFQYGLSTNPYEVIASVRRLKFFRIDVKIHLDLEIITKILEAVCGRRDAKLRIESKLYQDEQPPTHFVEHGLCSIFAGHMAKFGLNHLKIEKVSDALRLNSHTNVHLDLAFAHMLIIMTDKTAKLTWNESPERTWLLKVYGDYYWAALIHLSYSISKLKSDDIPLSNSVLKVIFGENMDISEISHGLLWCDVGLNPKKFLFTLRNSNNPEHNRIFREVGKLSEREKKSLEELHSFLERGTKLLESNPPSKKVFRFWQYFFPSGPYDNMISQIKRYRE